MGRLSQFAGTSKISKPVNFVLQNPMEREREIDCGCSLVEAAWAFALVSFCESCRGCLSEPAGVGCSNQSPILYNVRVVDLYRTQDIL